MVYGGLQEQLNLANTEIQRLSRELKVKNDKIANLELGIDGDNEKVTKIQKELTKLRKMNDELEKGKREHDRDRDELLFQIKNLKDTIAKSKNEN